MGGGRGRAGWLTCRQRRTRGEEPTNGISTRRWFPDSEETEIEFDRERVWESPTGDNGEVIIDAVFDAIDLCIETIHDTFDDRMTPIVDDEPSVHRERYQVTTARKSTPPQSHW